MIPRNPLLLSKIFSDLNEKVHHESLLLESGDEEGFKGLNSPGKVNKRQEEEEEVGELNRTP